MAANCGPKWPAAFTHMFGDDASLFGDGLPASVRKLVHIDHPIAPHDLSAQLAGPRRHRVGGRGRVCPTVVGGVETQHHPFGVHQGVQPPDLVGTHQVRLHPNQLQHSMHVFEPVCLIGVGGQPDRATAVPSGMQTGLFFKPVVELYAIGVDLGHVEAADEVGHQPGGVPCGTRGQFVLFPRARCRSTPRAPSGRATPRPWPPHPRSHNAPLLSCRGLHDYARRYRSGIISFNAVGGFASWTKLQQRR